MRAVVYGGADPTFGLSRNKADAKRGKLTWVLPYSGLERHLDGWFYLSPQGIVVNARRYRGRNWFTCTNLEHVVSFSFEAAS